MTKTITKNITSRTIKAAALSSVIIFSGSVFATDNLIPRVAANKFSDHYLVSSNIEYKQIIVKFNESTGIRLGNTGLTSTVSNPDMPSLFGLDWSAFTNQLDSIQNTISATGVNLSTLYTFDEETLKDLKEKGEQKTGKQLADLNLYFKLPIPSFYNADQVQQLIDSLNAFDTIEIAYAEPKPAIAEATPNFQDYDANNSAYQGYLDAPNTDDSEFDGINAKYAWNFSGGHGEGINVMDVEGGWNIDHEDFPTVYEYIGSEYSSSWVAHGTAVVGVIAGADNGFGVTGIASQVNLGVSSISQGTSTAITTAATSVGEGGIVLIEVHRQGPTQVETCSCNTSQCNYIAVEYWQADYDAIATATANGVIVVEAAGNGSVDLDDPIYEGKFDRSVRDSGAILVGGGASKSRSPMCWTNYGSRVDVHGWGENVTTLAYGNLHKNADDTANDDYWYTSSFSGTSSASPIIVGAAASIQGIAQSVHGETLTPAEMRDLLATTGTVQTTELAKNIGPLPNLENAITELDTIFNFACTEYTDSNSAHETAGRAYSVTETTGQTCWGTFCWGGSTTTTYYAQGSDENLGTSATTVTTLAESTSGVFTQGACPTDPQPPVIESYQIESLSYNQAVITGTASDADNDIDRVVLGLGAATGIVCEGTTSFTCTLDYTTYDIEVGVEFGVSLAAYDSRDEVSNIEQFTITRPEQDLGTAPAITNLDYTVTGQSMVVTVDVNDVDGDLTIVRLEYADDMGQIQCDSTAGSQYTCNLTYHDVGTFNFKVTATDNAGNISETAAFSVEFIEEPQSNSCATATNYEHVAAGRAYVGGISNLYAYATGSDDDLGLYGSVYYSSTTSLEENAPGVWIKVASCN